MSLWLSWLCWDGVWTSVVLDMLRWRWWCEHVVMVVVMDVSRWCEMVVVVLEVNIGLRKKVALFGCVTKWSVHQSLGHPLSSASTLPSTFMISPSPVLSGPESMLILLWQVLFLIKPHWSQTTTDLDVVWCSGNFFVFFPPFSTKLMLSFIFLGSRPTITLRCHCYKLLWTFPHTFYFYLMTHFFLPIFTFNFTFGSDES